jgi:hypothetical protein
MDEPREPPKICENIRTNENNKRVRCKQPGVPCWVSGSFGRLAKRLCNRCIKEVRDKGWTVRYQLESDAPAEPPPIGQEVQNNG